MEFYIRKHSGALSLRGKKSNGDFFLLALPNNEKDALTCANTFVQLFKSMVRNLKVKPLCQLNQNIIQSEQPFTLPSSLTTAEVKSLNSLPTGVIENIPAEECTATYLARTYKKNVDSANFYQKALAVACLGVLINKGSVTDFTRISDEINEILTGGTSKEYVGEVGTRITLAGSRILFKKPVIKHGKTSFLMKLSDDGKILNYEGTVDLGEVDDVIEIDTTIKEHLVLDGIYVTRISRPSKKADVNPSN